MAPGKLPALPRPFGGVRKLPGGQWQARWERGNTEHSARSDDGLPLTFTSEPKARAWLAKHADAIKDGSWTGRPPAVSQTVGAYGAGWIASRTLSARTAEHYRQLQRDHLDPTFGGLPITDLTPAAVRLWHGKLGTTTGPTARAHTYSLLKAICATAVDEDLIAANPCRLRGAGQARTVKRMRPATLGELDTITATMPPRLRAMVTLAVWCSLRFGELTELRRRDVDTALGIVHVHRAVVRVGSEFVVGKPKSAAGVRDVTIPPHVLPVLVAHLAEHVGPGPTALLFPANGDPSRHLAPASLYRAYYPARDAAGRPDLPFHGLRHTGQTLAASTGANLRELMNRAGQSSQGAALRYLHQVDGRQTEIAASLSALVGE